MPDSSENLNTYPMAKLITALLLLFSLHRTANSLTESTSEFIKTECRATRYPSLCLQCLSNYSTSVQLSQRQLAQDAISVSLSRAQPAAGFVSKLARMRGLKRLERGAVIDCAQNMGDSVDQLTRSMKELDGMGRVNAQDFEWHVSNVESWVSTALTNHNMCLSGFSGVGGNVKDAVTKRVLDCARVTSNALALVNRFATRHKQQNE